MEEGQRKNVGIMAFAIGFSLSLCLLVVASAFAGNWYPLLSFIVYILMVLPYLFLSVDNSCVACNVQLSHSFGFCMTGVVLSSLFGMPLVLWHADAVTEGYQMWSWMIANIVLLISMGIGTLAFDNDDTLGGIN
jgi:hypothetical protein